ncbi:hypothetical protein [Dyadobacter sp. Leaf189]|uniref:hypothetical protein n=1 Tax=Dyadobacter sp. Leaf189 TaxID=1736295 RepID=UPI0006F41C3C|nr:hypothetical protein [Dyadobacter sp. Leaf189]KQS28181.1 hypothetical protein ASG33_17515 [Dyadobacter sp. Leaf189]
MSRQSRKEELILKITTRLAELEIELLLPPFDELDSEYEELVREAVRLREALGFLTDFDEL